MISRAEVRQLLHAVENDDAEELMRLARQLTPGQVQDLRDDVSMLIDALAIADARDA